MRARNTFRRAILALGIALLLGSTASPMHAQGNCLTFGQARQAGLFAKFNLRPAASVKNAVEARTGGKVVSFLICRPGPVYKLTVIRKNGNVVTVTEPAQ
jgi:hypothetical protein